jgi:hypothetical protein
MVQLQDLDAALDLSVAPGAHCEGKPPQAASSGSLFTPLPVCREMEAGDPWTFQPDAYALCEIAHMLRFGQPLEVVQVRSPAPFRFAFLPPVAFPD